MLASRRHGTLYVGVTSDLISRVARHKNGEFEGFTKRYGVTRLVWYETHDLITEAIKREKALKKYKREWKINLIERENLSGMICCQICLPRLKRCKRPGRTILPKPSSPGVSPGDP